MLQKYIWTVEIGTVIERKEERMKERMKNEMKDRQRARKREREKKKGVENRKEKK